MFRPIGANARWVTVTVAARMIGVSPSYVRYLVDARRLPAKRVTFGIRLVQRCAVERFALERAERQIVPVPGDPMTS